MTVSGPPQGTLPRLAGLALFALAAVPTAPAAGQDAERWTPELSMRYQAVGETAISPDGSRVAYTVREPLMEGEQSEYLTHIWMVGTDGAPPAQWTRGDESAGDPAFAPDGAWLAFTTSRAGSDEASRQVWALPLAGGEARQITAAAEGVGAYRWSPDGSRIAFSMRDPETPEEEKARREKRDVILVDRDFKFSHLYVVAVDDEPAEPVRLTAGDFHVTGFDWSPAGDRLVFSHQADPRINTGRLSGDISVVTVPAADEIEAVVRERAEAESAGEEGTESDEAAGDPEVFGEVTRLVGGAGVERSPLWSPDGRWIAYASTGSGPEPIGLADLWVVSPDGGEPRALARTSNRQASPLAWSADSRRVFTSEPRGTTVHVVSVPLEGEEMRQVTSGQGVVGAVSMTEDRDRLAFTWQTPDTPWDVHVSEVASFEPRRLTDIHDGVPRPEMGRTELVRWSSTDGLEVEGLLTYPVGYEEGERVPLILNVHGGPAGVYLQSFTGGPSIYMLQYFAQEGFAILRPNPRGSTGYGKDFRYANFQDWGYGDFRDLMAGVDHAVDMGVADPERLLLMGWSYGGYMTSWAVTQTDRFRAASMGAGLPNLISMTTTTDIQDYLVGHMGVEFWEDYERYQRHSAIYHVANVVTPTQVIHGAEDLRVPFTQGQEFYRALDRRGVPTEMIVYPRTPHGPREPKFLMDVSERILAWFEKHLGGEPVATGGG